MNEWILSFTQNIPKTKSKKVFDTRPTSWLITRIIFRVLKQMVGICLLPLNIITGETLLIAQGPPKSTASHTNHIEAASREALLGFQ
jgi:hypothetical protein